MRVKYINQSHNSSQYMLGCFNNYLVGKKIWPLSFKTKSMWKICMCVLLCLKTMMRMTITNNNPQFDRHVVFSACSWIQRIERTSRKVFILELYLQENMSHTDLWVINCCLTSMEYFISVYIITRTSCTFRRDYADVRFVINQTLSVSELAPLKFNLSCWTSTKRTSSSSYQRKVWRYQRGNQKP